MWVFFFFSSRRRHTRCSRDWSSDVCSSDLEQDAERLIFAPDLFGIAEASFIFVGIMILCGMLPAMVISLDRPMSVIQRDSTGVSPAIRRLRRGLVAAQMTSCCVLVISTAFLVDGIRTALVTSAGQRLGRTVFVTAQANPVVAIEYFQRAEGAAKLVRGVSGVAWAGTLPGGQPMRQSFRIEPAQWPLRDRKSTRLNSSHGYISYAVFCLKNKR